jgi:hypothetical protein
VDSAFLNLVRGNRVTNYLGLFADSVKFGPDYTYVELAANTFANADGETTDKAIRNQHLQIVVQKFRPHEKYKVLVVTNPVLQRVASVPATYLIDGADSEHSLEVWATFRKDFAIEELTWAVRLYLMG